MKLKEEIKHDKIKDKNINTLIITKERKEKIYIFIPKRSSRCYITHTSMKVIKSIILFIIIYSKMWKSKKLNCSSFNI